MAYTPPRQASSSGFQRFLRCCVQLDAEYREFDGDYKLGYYSVADSKVVLYDAPTNAASLTRLRQRLDATGVSYRLIVEHPNRAFSNIYLLDVDV